jgi:hypothetical protein
MYNRTVFFLLLISAGIKVQSQNPVLKDSCNFTVSPIVRPVDTDKLLIGYSCNIQNFKFRIFDRWGKEVYFATTLSKQLDLNIYEKIKEKGGEVPKYKDGTYFWLAKYDVLSEGALFSKSSTGVITIYAGR